MNFVTRHAANSAVAGLARHRQARFQGTSGPEAAPPARLDLQDKLEKSSRSLSFDPETYLTPMTSHFVKISWPDGKTSLKGEHPKMLAQFEQYNALVLDNMRHFSQQANRMMTATANMFDAVALRFQKPLGTAASKAAKDVANDTSRAPASDVAALSPVASAS
jgi:hypothetical protein